MERALSKQRKARPPIALPFDEFELIHEALGHPIRIALGEPCKHCLFISFESLCEALHFRKATVSNLLLPGLLSFIRVKILFLKKPATLPSAFSGSAFSYNLA